jgi:hypothetical protein
MIAEGIQGVGEGGRGDDQVLRGDFIEVAFDVSGARARKY